MSCESSALTSFNGKRGLNQFGVGNRHGALLLYESFGYGNHPRSETSTGGLERSIPCLVNLIRMPRGRLLSPNGGIIVRITCSLFYATRVRWRDGKRSLLKTQ